MGPNISLLEWSGLGFLGPSSSSQSSVAAAGASAARIHHSPNRRPISALQAVQRPAIPAFPHRVYLRFAGGLAAFGRPFVLVACKPE